MINITRFATIVMALLDTSHSAPKAEFTAEEIRAKLLAAQNRIQSYSVVYRAGGYTGRSVPRGVYLHRIVQAKGPSNFFHLSAHGMEGLDWKDDFLHQCAYLKDDLYTVYMPVNRRCRIRSLASTAPLPGSLGDDFFIQTTGIWPLTARQAPVRGRQPVVLRDVGRSAEYATVRAVQELIGDRWCHVLEGDGLDRFWFDMHRNCTLMQREELAELPDNSRRRLAARYQFGGHREVKPGIWMPGWIRSVQFDYASRTVSGQIRVVKDTTVNILATSINDVTDSAFEFTPPLGTLKLTDNGEWKQSELGGLEHLDNVVKWIKAHRPAQPATISHRLRLDVLVGSMLAVLFVLEGLLRLRRRASS